MSRSMTRDEHFLRNMDDLRKVANSADDYELVKASALLRKLLIDGSRFVDVINRPRRLRLSFTVVDLADHPLTQTTLSLNPTTYLHADALHPDDALASMQTRKVVNLQALLATSVGVYDRKKCTIANVITCCANVLGGVHFGEESTTDDPEVEVMRKLNIKIAGMRPIVLQLRSIIKIVLDGLVPLEQAVRSAPLLH